MQIQFLIKKPPCNFKTDHQTQNAHILFPKVISWQASTDKLTKPQPQHSKAPHKISYVWFTLGIYYFFFASCRLRLWDGFHKKDILNVLRNNTEEKSTSQQWMSCKSCWLCDFCRVKEAYPCDRKQYKAWDNKLCNVAIWLLI